MMSHKGMNDYLSLICYKLCLFSLTGDTVCVALPEWGNFVLALCL